MAEVVLDELLINGDRLCGVPIAEWIGAVAKEVKADIIVQPTKADSPDGGHVACAVVKADPDAGKFPLKDKDTAMAAAFAFLRSKVHWPTRYLLTMPPHSNAPLDCTLSNSPPSFNNRMPSRRIMTTMTTRFALAMTPSTSGTETGTRWLASQHLLNRLDTEHAR
eukprot:scaffold129068_cov23-Tisochrysis_lutea.AAC.1